MHKSLLSLALLAALGGCSLIPDYERPDAPVAAAWPQIRPWLGAAGQLVVAQNGLPWWFLHGLDTGAVLHAADRRLLDHCLVGHVSAEPGHRKLLAAIHKRPVLEFDMRLGEGSGAALALGIVRSALACHNGMATFGEAGVSEG